MIDGHERLVILEYVIVNKFLKEGGLIIFDNSEGYNLSETLKNSKFSDLHKVDFMVSHQVDQLINTVPQ